MRENVYTVEEVSHTQIVVINLKIPNIGFHMRVFFGTTCYGTYFHFWYSQYLLLSIISIKKTIQTINTWYKHIRRHH